ncbi:MAG: AtpZ/AtpI family protein [Jatrophihabitans sp.]
MAAQSPSWSNLLGMGVVVAAQLLVGIALGLFLDSRFDTSPALLLVGLALGLVGAVAFTVMQFRKYLGIGSNSSSGKGIDHNDVSED